MWEKKIFFLKKKIKCLEKNTLSESCLAKSAPQKSKIVIEKKITNCENCKTIDQICKIELINFNQN